MQRWKYILTVLHSIFIYLSTFSSLLLFLTLPVTLRFSHQFFFLFYRISEISFDLLVRRQIARLEQPGLQCVDLAFDEMQRMVS